MEYICTKRRYASKAKRSLEVLRASASTDLEFKPRLRIVSIIPGMLRAEPERTLTRSGSFGSPKALSGLLFEALEVTCYFSAQRFGILLVVFIEMIASLRGDREAGGDRQADARHFGEARALAAEEIFHFAVAFGSAVAEIVDDISSCTSEVRVKN